MKQKHLFLLLLLAPCLLYAQNIPNVLFLGNSYTEVNNLPQMVSDIAQSMGERMTFEKNTPGGCTFRQHCGNKSMTMIQEGGWDIVVLQEQSQLPSFPQWQVEQECFPYAQRLVDSIYAHNPEAEPMFFMTWGHKNGDSSNASEFPVLATYEGMDSMLCERYTYMAEANNASLCPVGCVWRYLRTYNPDIELYQSDGSHPSIAGTYAAACSFYVMFFHRDPDSILFNASLDESTAQTIRTAVKRVVFDNLSHWQRPTPQNRIDNTPATVSLKVYPNPTTSLLTIETAGLQQLELQDLEGRTLKTYTPTRTPVSINLGNLPTGAYLLHSKTTSGHITQTIIKQ